MLIPKIILFSIFSDICFGSFPMSISREGKSAEKNMMDSNDI